MTDEAEKPRPPRVWGKRSQKLLADLKGQTVVVGATTEVAFKGELIGVDTHDIILKLESGTEVLIHRSNIIYVHKAR